MAGLAAGRVGDRHRLTAQESPDRFEEVTLDRLAEAYERILLLCASSCEVEVEMPLE